MEASTICIRMKDGKIMVARGGKPFFPPPLDKEVVVIQPNEEAFMVGPYPDKNVMIMRHDKYQEMKKELRLACPNARLWKAMAIIFMVMFAIVSMLHLHHWEHSRKLLQLIQHHWSKK